MSIATATDEIDALRTGHAALMGFANAARRAIASLKPEEMRARDLPLAMGEIGMIVQTSEEAANEIMDAVEEILTLSSDANAHSFKSKVEECCNRILQACSFQDLNGQRMSKVVETLLVIEDKLGAVTSALSGREDEAAAVATESYMAATDVALLNGPAMPGEGLDQSDIDRLFADS